MEQLKRYAVAFGAAIVVATLLALVLTAEPVSAQNPTPTPIPTPTPEFEGGFLAPITINDLPVPNPEHVEDIGWVAGADGLASYFKIRTSGIVRQYDALAYKCPSVVRNNSVLYAALDPEDAALITSYPGGKAAILETNAYRVLLCRTKGVVDYMVLAGSGLVGFFLVWTGLLHTMGAASDPQRQNQETLSNIFRILAGYTLLVMCYLFTSFFFHTNITPYLPFATGSP